MARNDVRFVSCNKQQGSTCPSCIYFGGTPEQVADRHHGTTGLRDIRKSDVADGSSRAR